MKKYLSILLTAILFFSFGVVSGPYIREGNIQNTQSITAESNDNSTEHASISSGLEELDQFTEDVVTNHRNAFGYPGNQNLELHDFYEWYTASGLDQVIMNNAGDPFAGEPSPISTQAFERHSIPSQLVVINSSVWIVPLASFFAPVKYTTNRIVLM